MPFVFVFAFAIIQMGRSGMNCAVNIISGRNGANGGIPGAGIYEPDEVVIVMIPSLMIITFLIFVDLFKQTNFFDPKFTSQKFEEKNTPKYL